MKLEEQVLTIEQAKHLQELGMDMSDASLCYVYSEGTKKDIIAPARIANNVNESLCYTYTLQEVMDRISTDFSISHIKNINGYYGEYEANGKEIRFFGVTALESAYYLLCQLLEDKKRYGRKRTS